MYFLPTHGPYRKGNRITQGHNIFSHSALQQVFLRRFRNRFWSLELKIGSLISEKSGPYYQRNRVLTRPLRVPNIFLKKTCILTQSTST